MEKIAVDILHISSPHKISVRQSDHREQYYHFRRELEVSCTESFLNGTLLSLPLERACPDQQCLVRLTSSWVTVTPCPVNTPPLSVMKEKNTEI